MDIYNTFNDMINYLVNVDPVDIAGFFLIGDASISIYESQIHPPSGKKALIARMLRAGAGAFLIYESLARKNYPIANAFLGAALIADGISSIVYAYKKCDDKYIPLHLLRGARAVLGAILIYYNL